LEFITLAVAENADHLSPDGQGIYKYIFQETNYGASTPFKEIKMANSLCYFELTAGEVIHRNKNISYDFVLSSRSFDDLIDEHSKMLQKQIHDVVASYGPKISTALSGGYDSRLMLALLKKENIEPGVYVYGPEKSADVTVAKTIAAGEGFKISHINKATHPVPRPKDYAQTVRDNFYALDGYPNEGIYDFGANMMTRRQRADKGTLIFNGGGGEIYRNFFYLPNCTYSIDNLLDSFYSRYTKDFCTNAFSEKNYRQNLKEKIMTALQINIETLTRTQLEFAYPGFRLRYWTSKDNTNNNRLGSFLTPFINYETIQAALKIPLHYKTHGKFQSALINKIHPSLASYPSDYGYSFNQDVPFVTRLKNNLTIYRPTFIRRYSYAIKHAMTKPDIPKTISGEYLDPILGGTTPYMDHYFDMKKIKDSGLMSRVLTLEYLFNHLKVQ
jgi:asparagine synthetase B (glutamine-hydrolysing)